MVCSRQLQSVEVDCEDHVVPPVKFLEPCDSNQSAASLTLHENDAVHVQLTSGTSSSNREEERPPEPITGFGSRAGTTNCDASGLGGFVHRYLSTKSLRITSNFVRCTMYMYLQQQSSSFSSNRFIEHDVSTRKLGPSSGIRPSFLNRSIYTCC